MFILRPIWITVFLAASFLLPGFPMVECKAVLTPALVYPGDSTRLPWKSTLPAATSATSTSIEPQPVSRFSSRLSGRDDDEEDVSENEVEVEEEDLQTVITRKYALHSVCSARSIYLTGKRLNDVRADASDRSPYARLTVRSVRPGEISIYNDLSKRYLCFNRHGKLIMRLEFRDKPCVFHERVSQNNHVILQSSYNKGWFVGFGRDGKSLQGNDWKNKLPKNQNCYQFLKSGEKIYESLEDVNPHKSPAEHRRSKKIASSHFRAPHYHKNATVTTQK
ncbi:hypothetical protein RvY_04743 [Ramazzottius varieornatus]|uniref:FGF n=1 Tax=Ramazzottius varieornatus TaxID=947166 RepID=A0A1D1USN3_RAMVA|nr:hypothetical protein RvY_04743 [Ramazzottius varieornatus]